MEYFVTAIGTDSGKTVVSSILCEALKADYWKPVQAGFPRDAETVKSLLTNTTSQIHAERYLLKTPASPHAAAKIDGITIDLNNFTLPQTNNPLIIEGAGGCLVPLSDEQYIIDLICLLNCPVILVSNLYLGSINHTLLTVEALQKRKVHIVGVIFNGESNYESERIILQRSALRCLLRIDKESVINKLTVAKYAELLLKNWK
jgi:dethiobiotin synthetase